MIVIGIVIIILISAIATDISGIREALEERNVIEKEKNKAKKVLIRNEASNINNKQ